MKVRTVAIIFLGSLIGCVARPEVSPPRSSLLWLGLGYPELTLCEGMTRYVAVAASWTGSTQPDVADLPEITWMSTNPEIVRVEPGGGVTGLAPGTGDVIVHGRLGDEIGRARLPVTVRAGAHDARASRDSGEMVCRPG